MRFVGVSTGGSSIMKVFPVWSQVLALDADLVGLDLPLDATPSDYRTAMEEMRADPDCVGALVTTHKIALHDAARDMFDHLDEFAASVGEVSSIAFRDGEVHGAAKDPVTAGLALEEVLSPGHFTRGGHVLCLGAGGAGTAIGWYLAHRPDPPARMTFVDVDPARLAHLRQVVAAHLPPGAAAPTLEVLPTADTDVRQLLTDLPPHSLVVNATGLGKDRPGSPLPADATFPEQAVAWELNYRGTLEFLQQARAQEAGRDLTVVDGWRYFIHGWTQVIADVFQLPMDADTVGRLAEVAQDARHARSAP
jgi:shikimate 5-dehydrogenase